ADFPQISARIEGRAAALKQIKAQPTPAAPVHIDAEHAEMLPVPAAAAGGRDRFMADDGGMLSLSEIERDLIVFAIEKCGGHMSQVARNLGIGRSTLYRKLKEYGLDENAGRDAA